MISMRDTQYKLIMGNPGTWGNSYIGRLRNCLSGDDRILSWPEYAPSPVSFGQSGIPIGQIRLDWATLTLGGKHEAETDHCRAPPGRFLFLAHTLNLIE